MGSLDTVVFSAVLADTFRARSFELGDYDEYYLSVNYTLTPGSYHRSQYLPEFGEKRDLLKFSRMYDFFEFPHPEGRLDEVEFLGLSFDKYFVDSVSNAANVVNLDKKKARYWGVNIKKGVVSFRFSFSKGVVSFVDGDGIEWTLQE